MKRLFRKIHLWLAAPFGLVISIVCFTGAILIFEDELTEMAAPSKYKIDRIAGNALSIDSLAHIVAGTLPEDVSVTGVTVSDNPHEPYRVNISQPRHACVLIDQYTGEIKGSHKRGPFFSTVFKLHRWLLDSGKPEGRPAWGKMIVGVSTIMFVIVLLSGLVLWIPRSRKALTESLKIITGKNRFRLWRSLHVAGGMYAIVLLLAMALTGLTWSFSWYRSAFYGIFGVELASDSGGHGNKGGGHGRNGNNSHEAGDRKRDGHRQRGNVTTASWQKVYDRLNDANPHAAKITVGNGTASVSYNRAGNSHASDKYEFDKRTGAITSVTKYSDSTGANKMRGWIYSVHTGAFAGLPTRILWFLAALLGASLPLTGYYLWIRRIKRRQRKELAG